MSSNERAASAIRSSSTGRSPSVSVSDSFTLVAMPQLQPYIADRVLAAAEQQIGFHGPVLGGERVQSLRVDAAIKHEREQHLKSLGLSRAVRTAQDQPAAGEAEFLVPV